MRKSKVCKPVVSIILAISLILSSIPFYQVLANVNADAFVPNTIAAGYNHTLAIKTDGTLWAWGWNKQGQLGDGTYKDSSIPIKILDDVTSVSAGGALSMAIKKDHSLWEWGQNAYVNSSMSKMDGGSPVPIKIMDDVLGVSVDDSYVMAIKTTILYGRGVEMIMVN